MPDRFLAPPIRSGYGGAAAREARIMRDRQAAHENALDVAATRSAPQAAARMLVQVYDGGSMPSSPNLWYFTHPVLCYGDETEGGAATLEADTDTTIPVIVLRGVPSVGDYLTAYSVGGRWVAELAGCSITIGANCGGAAIDGDTVTVLKGATTVTSGTTDSDGDVKLSIPLPLTNPYTVTITGGGNPNFSTSQTITCGDTYNYNVCAGLGCSPCNIPQEDLTVTWTNSLTGNGSATLVYADDAWSAGCVDNGLLIQLACTEGEIELRVYYYVTGECPDGEGNYCSNLGEEGLQLTLASYTCSPFSLTFQCTDAGCPNVFEFGNSQFTVTL
jgi:hypothetical protein